MRGREIEKEKWRVKAKHWGKWKSEIYQAGSEHIHTQDERKRERENKYRSVAAVCRGIAAPSPSPKAIAFVPIYRSVWNIQ